MTQEYYRPSNWPKPPTPMRDGTPPAPVSSGGIDWTQFGGPGYKLNPHDPNSPPVSGCHCGFIHPHSPAGLEFLPMFADKIVKERKPALVIGQSIARSGAFHPLYKPNDPHGGDTGFLLELVDMAPEKAWLIGNLAYDWLYPRRANRNPDYFIRTNVGGLNLYLPKDKEGMKRECLKAVAIRLSELPEDYEMPQPNVKFQKLLEQLVGEEKEDD